MKKLLVTLGVIGLLFGGCAHRRANKNVPLCAYNSIQGQTAAQFAKKYVNAYLNGDYERIIEAQNVSKFTKEQKADLGYNLADGVAKFKCAVAVHGGLSNILTEEVQSSDGVHVISVTLQYKDNQADTIRINIAEQNGRWIVLK